MRHTYRRLHDAFTRMPPSLRGIVLMTVSVGMATGTHGVIRHLGSDLPPEEVVVIRHFFALLTLGPFIMRAGLRRTLGTHRFGLHVTRGMIGGANALAWYTGLTLVPFVVATSLSFTAVIFLTVGAVLFLGEKAGPRRWSAVIIGFVGAVIILRPGVEVITPGAMLIMGSAVLSGVSMLLLKLLTRTESPLTIVTYMYLFRIGVAAIPAALHWVTPTLEHLLWFVLIGVVSSATNMAQAQAFKDADATLLAPVRFTRLVWAALIGFFVFAETPDLWTWVGAAVIGGSISYIAFREAQLKKARNRAAEE
jgi:drug/metabolite transporter (DMT)-like permease